MNELDLFAAAIAIAEPTERDALLDRECSDRPELRMRLQLLLDQHARSQQLLDRPHGANRNDVTALWPDKSLAGMVIAGRYKLLEQIGDGGMGAVWMAEQREPVKRLVAVKLIKPGMDSKAVLARFEAERQALALMDHPNIAKVHDAGTDENGRPYFVMELVKGLPLTEYCDARKLTVNERLDLFVQICSAVQHAHQKAVIHRDLKPTNVLVTEHDGHPVPKVIDFGLAKALNASQMLTDRTLHTAFGTVVGTPLYMAPEQVGINTLDVDTRTDIYALGVILYELLTGTTPLEKARFKEAAWEEVKRLIREEEPPRPSTRLSSDKTLPSLAASRQVDPGQLRRQVQGELDWIVMKALDKDRSRRYETATGLAKDVQRFLDGDAVEACPPTVSYRLQKLYRKNRGTVWVGSTIATILLISTAVSLTFGIRARRAEHLAGKNLEVAVKNEQDKERERDRANTALQKLEEKQKALEDEQNSRARADYVTSIQFAQAAWQQQQFWPTRNFLDRTPPELRGWEWHYLNRLCQPEKLDSLSTADKPISSAQYSPDGRWIVTVSGPRIWDANPKSDSSVEFWDTATLKPSFTLCSRPGLLRVDISSDGQQVLVTENNKVTIWDISDPKSPTPQTLIEDDPDEQNYYTGCFSPDGKTIAIQRGRYVDDNTKLEFISLWDVSTRQLNWSHGSEKTLASELAFAADGQWVYSLVHEDPKDGHILKIWDVNTSEELLAVGQKFTGVRVFLSPDGSRLAALLKDGSNVAVWRIRRDGIHPVLDDDPMIIGGHPGLPYLRAFSRDSKYLPTAGSDGTVRIWDVSTMTQIRVLAGAGFTAYVNFSPDAQSVITWEYGDSNVRVWPVKVADPQLVSEAEVRDYRSIPSPNGKRLLTFDDTETKVCETGTLKPLYSLAKGRGGWSPDGRRIWISIDRSRENQGKNKVCVYNAETGHLIRELEGVQTPKQDHCCNADGTQVLIVKGLLETSVHVWDTNTDQTWELAKPVKSRYWGATYSPDGTKIFVDPIGEENSTRTGLSILDAETRESIELERSALDRRGGTTFSQDGRLFMGLFFDPDTPKIDCKIWDTTTGKLLRSFPVNVGYAPGLEISPDGSRILVKSNSFTLHLIDAESGAELLVLPINGMETATFDRDGNKIIVNVGDKVRVLDGTPLQERKE